MSAPAYDVTLGGKGYLLTPGGWSRSESPKSYPSNGGASSVEFRHGDNWSYWGQDEWNGQGQDLWHGNGPFDESYGIDLSKYGQIKIAKQLGINNTDETNTTGYIMFAVGTTRACFIGKTNGKLFVDSTAAVQKNLGDAGYLPAGALPRSYVFYKQVHYIGCSNGVVYSTTDGLNYSAITVTGGPATDCTLLGSFRGKLYASFVNQLFTWDGTTWTEIFLKLIDGAPIAATVASSQLFFITAGPFAKIYSTDGNQLHQIGSLSNRFAPYAVVSLETIYFFGGKSDAATTAGEIWRINNGVLELVQNVGDDTADYAIRSAITENGVIYWGNNQQTGLGCFDSRLDLYEDIQTGFYGTSSITSVSGVVDGIVQFNNIIYVGIRGSGVYKQTTPGTFGIRSSLFDADSRNINKMWGFAELKHLALTAGQYINIGVLKNEVTVDAWGLSNVLASQSAIIQAPTSPIYENGFIRYDMSGDANGSPMTITSLAIAYMELSKNPKREWELSIALEGSQDIPQVLRDGADNERTAQTMLNDLDALWNTYTTYVDVDNKAYNVVVKHPSAHADEIIRDEDVGGVLGNVYIVYRLHLTQLS